MTKRKPIILPSGQLLRGAQSAKELNLKDYFRLAYRFARQYERILGDEAEGVAMEALAVARDRWVPAKGPFAVLAALHMRSALNYEVDRRLKQDGVRRADRPKGRYVRPKGKSPAATPGRTYQLISQNTVGPSGSEIDLLDEVPGNEPTPEEHVLGREKAKRQVRKVRGAVRGLKASRSRVEEILAKDASVAAMRHELRQLGPRVIAKLRRELEGNTDD